MGGSVSVRGGAGLDSVDAKELASLAAEAKKQECVLRFVRDNEIDGRTALQLDDDDLKTVSQDRLEHKKLRAALEHFWDACKSCKSETEKVAVPAAAEKKTGKAAEGKEDDAVEVRAVSDAESCDDDDSSKFFPLNGVWEIAPSEVVVDVSEALDDGAGHVYGATWRRGVAADKRVAVRKVSLGKESKAADVRREVEELFRLTDPNLLILHGAGTGFGKPLGGELCIVAERADSSLAKEMILRDPEAGAVCRWSRADIIHVASNVASALAYLHEEGVAHLALAPSNVLCYRKPTLRCKVANFGTSRRTLKTRLAESEKNDAALAYVAPELLHGDADAALRATLPPCDAWSFGAILEAIISRARPTLKTGGGAPSTTTTTTLCLRTDVGLKQVQDIARECCAEAPSARPSLEDVAERFNLIRAADLTKFEAVSEALDCERANDADAYSMAWGKCQTISEDGAVNGLLELCARVAAKFSSSSGRDDPARIVRHASLAADANVADLLDLAAASSEVFHGELRRRIGAFGGTYERAPTKTVKRIEQKARSVAYAGDVGRVVDVERGTVIFEDDNARGFEDTLTRLCIAFDDDGSAAAADDSDIGARLILRRFKDRFHTPVEGSGYRDVLLNLELARTGFVGELQLTFRGLAAIKPSAHRIYNIYRALDEAGDGDGDPATTTATVPPRSRPGICNFDFLKLRLLLPPEQAGGSERSVRAVCGGTLVLQRALERTLPAGCGLTSLYDGFGGAAQVRLDVRDVAALQALRDDVLAGAVDAKLRDALATAAAAVIAVDRSAFAERLATSLMRFDALTPHQRKALVQTRSARAILLTSPAGGGKTFVAVARAVEVLEDGGRVVFASRHESLALFFCKWLATKLAATRGWEATIQYFDERVRVVVGDDDDDDDDDDDAGGGRQRGGGFSDLQIVKVGVDRLIVAVDAAAPRWARRAGNHRRVPTLVVVDEAHHVAAEDVAARLRARLRPLHSRSTTYLCLADASQAATHDDVDAILTGIVPWAAGGKEDEGGGWTKVALTEVVRSTQRIVVGSSAFQLAAGRKAETRANAASVGPPLKASIFAATAEDDDAAPVLFAQYAKRVAAALADLADEYPGLDLHDRVAVVVPDAAFLAGLRTRLSAELPSVYEIVDATTASAALPHRRAADDDAGASGESDSKKPQWLVVDTIANFDGLERLFAICVGLDTPLDENDHVAAQATRSRLYRAMTRAQLGVVVVNHAVPGGWLEFLGHINFSADGNSKFDGDRERRRAAAVTADDFCKERRRPPGGREGGDGSTGTRKENPIISRESPRRTSTPQSSERHSGRHESESLAASLDPPSSPAPGSLARKTIVQQSIWDTSSCLESKSTSGAPRFMPFAESTDNSQSPKVSPEQDEALVGVSKHVYELVERAGNLAPLAGLGDISILDLNGLDPSDDVRIIADLKKLTKVNLKDCMNLFGNVAAFAGLINLATLELENTQLTGDVAAFNELKVLTMLNLQACKLLTGDVAAFKELKGLTHLNLGESGNLKGNVAVFKELKQLTELYLGKCGKLTGDVVALKELKGLTFLNLHECDQLTGDVETLEELKGLTYLNLVNCNQLTGNVAAFAGLINLATLNLENTQLTGDVAALKELKGLTYLNLYECDQLTGDVAALKELKGLTYLNLFKCHQFTGNVAAFAGLINLATLILWNTQLTGDVAAFNELKVLTELNLGACKLLTGNVAVFKELKQLTALYLGKCGKLTGDVVALKELKGLTYLDLFNCHQLTGDKTELRRKLPKIQIYE